MTETNPPLKFVYTNWQKSKAVRAVRPISFWFGKTKWHPEEQWLLKAYDLDKDAERDFAVKDIEQFL